MVKPTRLGISGEYNNDKSGDTTGWCFQIFAGTATYQMSMSSKMVHTTGNDRSRWNRLLINLVSFFKIPCFPLKTGMTICKNWHLSGLTSSTTFHMFLKSDKFKVCRVRSCSGSSRRNTKLFRTEAKPCLMGRSPLEPGSNFKKRKLPNHVVVFKRWALWLGITSFHDLQDAFWDFEVAGWGLGAKNMMEHREHREHPNYHHFPRNYHFWGICIYIWYHIYGLQTNAFLVFSFCLEWQNSLPSMMQKLPRLFCKRGFVQRWCCANESGSLIPVVDIRVSQSRRLAIFTAREVTTSRH